jgi:hypothetical protein
MLRTIFALLVISLFAAVGPAQVKDEEYKISPRDKAEPQRLAKRFVARIKQTHDFKSMIPEFYLKDFDLVIDTMFEQESYRPRLTRKEWLRTYRGAANLVYLHALKWTMGGGDALSSILPPALGKELEDMPD